MPKYVIEREIPKIGEWTSDQLKAASRTSCNVLVELGPDIEWHHSYVTGDKLYCVYSAASEDLIREHALRGGFPANKISELVHMIGPETAGE
ncbi:MAG TPA: DUF4242 domain-containing protein [Pyrinomonadaceae bacterium]|jgi:hypothetical protein|nr:DUF4242 domain-containing protein [Pyrinomonadaceae bacterium]